MEPNEPVLAPLSIRELLSELARVEDQLREAMSPDASKSPSESERRVAAFRCREQQICRELADRRRDRASHDGQGN